MDAHVVGKQIFYKRRTIYPLIKFKLETNVAFVLKKDERQNVDASLAIAYFVKVYVNFANVCLKEIIKTCARLAVCIVCVRKKCTLTQCLY